MLLLRLAVWASNQGIHPQLPSGPWACAQAPDMPLFLLFLVFPGLNPAILRRSAELERQQALLQPW